MEITVVFNALLVFTSIYRRFALRFRTIAILGAAMDYALPVMEGIFSMHKVNVLLIPHQLLLPMIHFARVGLMELAYAAQIGLILIPIKFAKQ
jgi:hypothetical protein